jgi:hypothetical protein
MQTPNPSILTPARKTSLNSTINSINDRLTLADELDGVHALLALSSPEGAGSPRRGSRNQSKFSSTNTSPIVDISRSKQLSLALAKGKGKSRSYDLENAIKLSNTKAGSTDLMNALPIIPTRKRKLSEYEDTGVINIRLPNNSAIPSKRRYSVFPSVSSSPISESSRVMRTRKSSSASPSGAYQTPLRGSLPYLGSSVVPETSDSRFDIFQSPLSGWKTVEDDETESGRSRKKTIGRSILSNSPYNQSSSPGRLN